MTNLNLNSTTNWRRNLTNFLKIFNQERGLVQTNRFYLCICFVAGIYLAIVEPFLVSLFLMSSLFFFSINYLLSLIPTLSNKIGLPLKFWQIASLITSLLILFSLLQLPSQAVFLENLEQFVVTLAQGAGTGVTADSIQLIFNLIRAIFLVLVAVAALFAYNQAQQGNDWRPIASQAGMAFGIILAIDVITFLFVGDGGP